jgi:hypothetical protein
MGMSTDPAPQAQDNGGSPAEPIDPRLEELTEVTFKYEKSRFCRVIHTDGAWGGVTAQGNIYMALVSEHAGMPETIKYAIDKPGGLREISRADVEGIVREVEVEVVMSEATARVLRTWLDDKIELIEKARSAREQQNTDGS